MSLECPDVHDAELILKLYDLRRESVMRDSRKYMISSFLPKTFEEFVSHTRPDHPQNAAFRQVTTYWEMAFSFARHGVMNADLLAENSGEGIFIYAKVEPFIAQFRETTAPTAFTNAEWLVTNSKAGQYRLELFRKRVTTLKEQSK